ncbi:hypothetical protein JX265_001743 [Neoarthrinium moseri]|uniref:Uncharacterized protein n=1 Tax=Neoarthrinium moseri TaxID=1658444 RepID=A0A9P9WVK8_9PEZI|nr:hypothetical protein JX265_001743 [Neoarthrinium moseri]
MGLIRKTFTAGLVGVGAGVGYLTTATTFTSPLRKDDPLIQSSILRKLNKNQNPVLSDICVKRVPLSKIRPELRNDEAALSTEFCRAVWSGWALAPQRFVQSKTSHGPATAQQLWKKADLASSTYEVGAQFVDHFEVVERSSTDVMVRAGGSPLDQGPRELEGLLLTSVRIDRAAGEAELSLASVFFKGQERVTDGSGPAPYPIEILHQLYARALVLAGSQGVQ